MGDSSASNQVDKASRRDFIKKSSIIVAGGAVGGGLSVARTAHAQGSDEIRIGLIGCGARGTGAASHALNTKGPTRLVAMADASTLIFWLAGTVTVRKLKSGRPSILKA